MIDRVGLPLELHDAMAQHQGTMPAAGERERAYPGIRSAAEPRSNSTPSKFAEHGTTPDDRALTPQPRALAQARDHRVQGALRFAAAAGLGADALVDEGEL